MTASDAEAMHPKESMIVGPHGRIDGGAGIRPSARANPAQGPLLEQTSDTPQGTPPARTAAMGQGMRRASPAPVVKMPPVFYAALAGIFGLVLLSLIGLIVVLVTFKSGGAEAVDYGVAVVATEPKGAHVFIDGEDTGEVTPMQASVPKDRDFTVLVQLDGYRAPEEKIFKLDGKDSLQLPKITLEKK